MGLLALATVIALSALFFWSKEKRERRCNDLRSQDELVFTQIELDHVNVDFVSDKARGRLFNRSARSVESVVVQLTVDDCYRGKCSVVAQKRLLVIQHIPSGQARDFSLTAGLSIVRAMGQLRIAGAVVNVHTLRLEHMPICN
ncbi:MAG: hypothetical protein MN733_26525 [Nitrososphaera sp.]|nr:hypothetical protein [Nitrososphaera sp.]